MVIQRTREDKDTMYNVNCVQQPTVSVLQSTDLQRSNERLSKAKTKTLGWHMNWG
jgi:hypothetical protein